MTKKIIIIINGKGLAGKDSICNIVAKYYPSKIVSSISPILPIAKLGGWLGEKDDKSRKLLSDLKKIFTDYNELPLKYLIDETKMFLQDNNTIMFVHIRESFEIDKFVDYVKSSNFICKTLLVQRNNKKIFGNISDDLVEDYNYDYIFENNSNDIFTLEKDVVPFINKILIENKIV